ncbi:hypothetical protein KUA19_25190 [Catellatospora sp. NEAU-YM18]|nr:hypothetical protein [Catellatospora tritici]MBV1853437.1 hypothetical protein [Catellatospora tritici]
MIAIVVAGIGVAVATVVTYHEATKIDRTNPRVVLDEYLRAAVVKKDSVGVDLYSCADASGLEPVNVLRTELDRRQAEFGVDIEVSWGAIDTTDNGAAKTATVSLSITARNEGKVESRSREEWQFTLRDEDGWRVCSANKVVVPTPSPSDSPSSLA